MLGPSDWQRHLLTHGSESLLSSFRLYGSVFLKHENLDLNYGKRMNFAFQSHIAELYCFQSFFEEVWLLNKIKSMPPVSAKSPWGLGGVVTGWGASVTGQDTLSPWAGQSSSIPARTHGEDGNVSLVLSPWAQADRRPHSQSHSTQCEGPTAGSRNLQCLHSSEGWLLLHTQDPAQMLPHQRGLSWPPSLSRSNE